MLRRRPDGQFESLGRAEGIERLGGIDIDIDQAIFGYVVRSAGPQLAGLLQVGPENDDLSTRWPWAPRSTPRRAPTRRRE